MGARYSLILAKDESGFLLWPTQFKWEGKLYNYTVRESPLRPKGRDIIKEYVTAAKKKGVETVTLPPTERAPTAAAEVCWAGRASTTCCGATSTSTSRARTTSATTTATTSTRSPHPPHPPR